MGAGILPVAVYKGTLFLLLGKERNDLWSDFGGSAVNKEEIFKTAIREAMLDGIIENSYDAAYAMMLEEGKKLGLHPHTA